MVIKAGILKMKIKEIPITLHRDKRDRPPHLNTWRDGWRHLKFMLLYAPNFIFVLPGGSLFALGTILVALQAKGAFILGPIYMDIHSMIFGLTLALLGLSILQMGLIIKLFSHLNVYYKKDRLLEKLAGISLERGVLAGLAVFIFGILVDSFVLIKWIENGFHNLSMLRTTIFGLYFIIGGASIIFFFLMRETMRRD
jgi:hypothetical protein